MRGGNISGKLRSDFHNFTTITIKKLQVGLPIIEWFYSYHAPENRKSRKLGEFGRWHASKKSWFVSNERDVIQWIYFSGEVYIAIGLDQPSWFLPRYSILMTRVVVHEGVQTHQSSAARQQSQTLRGSHMHGLRPFRDRKVIQENIDKVSSHIFLFVIVCS